MAPWSSDYRRHVAEPVDAVFRAIADRSYSSAERDWLKRIEKRRAKLIDSTDVIEYVDYGAGSSTSVRTAAEMAEGVKRTQVVGQLTKVASKNPKWAGLLLRLVREFKPKRCIELGAAAGISGAYQAAALELNGSGTLTSLEGGGSIAALASSTLAAMGLDHRAKVVTGRFQDTLDDTIAAKDVDYAFIDGHHDDHATREYFNTIVAKMPRPALVLLDDIAWSPGMQSAWQHVSRLPVVEASFDLGAVGVCVIGEAKYPLHLSIDY